VAGSLKFDLLGRWLRFEFGKAVVALGRNGPTGFSRCLSVMPSNRPDSPAL